MTHFARRLLLLQYGAERVAKSLSLRGGPQDLYWEPLIGVLVETDEGWVLFDTGMARDALDSDEVQQTYREAAGASSPEQLAQPWPLYPSAPDPDRWNWGLPGDPLVAALASQGLTAHDLSLAVISHLHLDHSGGIPTLAAAGVPVAVQDKELTFARSGAVGLSDGFREADWSAEGITWERLEGDTEVAPGVDVLSTPGHTPGHCSLRVRLPVTGTWIFTADATDLGQNLMDAVPCGSCAGGTSQDEELATHSLQRLLRVSADTDARLIPGHDQVMLNAVRHPKGGHR